jgi:hypothetical protein
MREDKKMRENKQKRDFVSGRIPRIPLRPLGSFAVKNSRLRVSILFWGADPLEQPGGFKGFNWCFAQSNLRLWLF